jgi:hypothetical protein
MLEYISAKTYMSQHTKKYKYNLKNDWNDF